MHHKNLSGVLYGKKDIRVEALERPEVNKKGIIIKVAKVGICGSDMHFYHDMLLPKGSVPGHEFNGEVVEVGEENTDFKKGDRVVVNPLYDLVGIGGKTKGGFANYVHIEEAKKNYNVIKLPDAMSYLKGALVEPLSVALYGINVANLSKDDNILVTGVGTIGLMVVSALHAKGFKKIAVSDVNEKKLKMAMKLGANHIHLANKEQSLDDFVVEVYGKQPNFMGTDEMPNLQVAIDCSGVAAVISNGIKALGVDGKSIIYSLGNATFNIALNDSVLNRKKIIGSSFYEDSDFMEAIKILSDENTLIPEIVTHNFSLKELPKAFETADKDPNAIKVMVTP